MRRIAAKSQNGIGDTMGAGGVGDGLIRTGNGLIRLGWAITKGTFRLLMGFFVLSLLIGGCVTLFG